MGSQKTRPRHIIKAIAGAFLLLFLPANTAIAFNTISVTARVNSANTFSGCFSPLCNRPNLFVVFYGTGTSSQAPMCKSDAVPHAMNVGNPAPADWRCAFQVQRPGRLYIGLYHAPNGNNTQGEQLDISPGLEKSASVDLENLARTPGVTLNLQSSGDDAQITYSVSAVINPGELESFTADQTTFQPSAGQQILLTAKATGAPYTFLRIRGSNTAGAEVWNIFGYLDTPGQEEKTFVWQGRAPDGTPLPPGDYTLKLEGSDSTTGAAAIGILPQNGMRAVGGILTQVVTILPPPASPTLGVTSLYPSPWSPEVGDLGITVVSSAKASISGEVFTSETCTGTKIADLSPLAVDALRPDKLTWNGKTTGGGSVAAGNIGIKVSGTSNGAATTPASLCEALTIISATTASLYVRHIPFFPDPGQTVELTANSVDAAGAPRIVGRLDVWAFVQSVPGTTPAPPMSPLKSCAMVATCTATITLPAGGSFLTWRASAEDRGAGTIATSGWRGQRVIGGANFANATLFSMPVDAAFNGPTMGDARDESKSFDLLFSVSTDFDWTLAADRQTIGDALDRFMTRLWGVEGAGGPSLTTFIRRADLVRIWVTPERNVVTWDPAANLCNWTAPSSPWADAIAVLHRTDCRDNADPSIRSFSAKLLTRDAIFHELHHGLFGLEDEYCSKAAGGVCLGDGGYAEDQPNPNIYNTFASCVADALFKVGGCSTITEIDVVTRARTGRTFFRLDSEPLDVMINNSIQRSADTRRANWKEGQCDTGGC